MKALSNNTLVFNAPAHYIRTLFYKVGAIPKVVSDVFKNEKLIYLIMPYEGFLYIVESSNFIKTELTTKDDIVYDTFVNKWLSVSTEDDIDDEAARTCAMIEQAAAERTYSTMYLDLSSDLLSSAEILFTDQSSSDSDTFLDDIDSLPTDDNDKPTPAIVVPDIGPGEDAETEDVNRLISDHLLQIKALMSMRDELEPSSIESVYVVVSADGVDYTHEL